jgi:hypothetical protein
VCAELKAVGPSARVPAYDPEGQLLAGSMADYMVPTASDAPDTVLIHQHPPLPLNLACR